MAQLSTLGIMRTITSFILVILVAGCVSSQPAAHLTKKEVTQTAVDLVQQAGFALDNYQPKTVFLSDVGRWRVSFDQKKPGPGTFLVVFVDDKTGVGKLMPSKL